MKSMEEITLKSIQTNIQSLNDNFNLLLTSLDQKFKRIDDRFEYFERKSDSRHESIDKRLSILHRRIDILHGKMVAMEREQRDSSIKLDSISIETKEIKNLYDSIDDKLESSMIVSNKVLDNFDSRLRDVELKQKSTIADKSHKNYKRISL